MAPESDTPQAIKETLLGASEAVPGLNLELLKSWQRSKEAIGMPANVRDVPQVPVDTLDAHILDMFQAPLTRVSEDFQDTGLGLLLADSRGQILQRWTHDHGASAYLDRLGTIRGAVLSEQAVGTNGVGTVAATGRAVQIVGREHFADFYSGAVCTGAPVHHPATGKLLAVVTVSTDVSRGSNLLRPLVNSVATQLEQQVLELQGRGARTVYEAFVRASRQQPWPVIAFGPQGLVMQSRSASRLSSADIALLEHNCAGLAKSGRITLELSAGTVEIQVAALDDTAGTVVVLERDHPPRATAMGPARSQLVGRSVTWLRVARDVARYKEARTPMLIAGEPGVGKSSLALGLPSRSGVSTHSLIDAAERYVSGSRKWLQRVADRLDTSAPTIIRGVESLNDSTVDGLRSLLDRRRGHGSVLLTMSAALDETARDLSRRLDIEFLWVPPLRERTVDLPLLWQHLSEQFAPGAGLMLDGAALELMNAYSWPDNVKELRSIVQHMATAGKRGPVLAADLPTALRGSRGLSMIEQAELDAIRKALAEADGNRSKAAKILGLSRATIYRKLRTYRLTA